MKTKRFAGKYRLDAPTQNALGIGRWSSTG
jgi:hypothetical protein